MANNIDKQKYNYYFKYFLVLEERFNKILTYIELDESNFNVFSIELSSLINECCSLMIGAVKQYYQEFYKLSKEQQDRFNMVQCKKFIKSFDMCNYKPKERYVGQLVNEIVICDGIYVIPWNSIKSGNASPKWWKNYTNIKHCGKDGYKSANLLTAIFCMSAMFIVLFMIDDVLVHNWNGTFSLGGNCASNIAIVNEKLLV